MSSSKQTWIRWSIVLAALAASGCIDSLEDQELESGELLAPEEVGELSQGLSNPIGHHDGFAYEWINGAEHYRHWGWACDPDNYSQPVDIHFYFGNVVPQLFLGSTTANLPREPGVANACGAYNAHGFSFRFSLATICQYRRRFYLEDYIFAYAIDLNGVANPLLTGSPIDFFPYEFCL